jgi:NAD(P)-dependent dehydrogenase (short-subunit alcohol dehydrogenase family)
MQSISQVPYEDIISAHSVNTFVPLILVRELLLLMGSATLTPPTASSSNTPSKPLAYIINVSSREGIFESNPNSSAKHGHHVHTNLTKAALNMLTETEASPAWRSRKVAMNTVDPGYMSAAPEIMEQWKENGRSGCPIGWEDGVGRVLWPIAVGERSEPVWGRFLKHFGKVEVDVGVGR